MHFQLYIKKANSLTAGRQTDRQTDIHIDRYMQSTRKKRRTYRYTSKEKTDRATYNQVVDRQTDRQTYI